LYFWSFFTSNSFFFLRILSFIINSTSQSVSRDLLSAVRILLTAVRAYNYGSFRRYKLVQSFGIDLASSLFSSTVNVRTYSQKVSHRAWYLDPVTWWSPLFSLVSYCIFFSSLRFLHLFFLSRFVHRVSRLSTNFSSAHAVIRRYLSSGWTFASAAPAFCTSTVFVFCMCSFVSYFHSAIHCLPRELNLESHSEHCPLYGAS
jgi:hypothetical protein